MHINDLETAAALLHLINLIDDDRGDMMTVKTIKGEVGIPKALQGAFAGVLKQLAYANMGRLGVECLPITPETVDWF